VKKQLIANSIAVLTVAGMLAAAAPATAEATGTVKARTQRTSAANLASQVGWYEVGTAVTPSCSTHGQPVKGFFSFNIPGGWDNLWYRTADGNYIADVDIETGTLNSVAPDCGDLTPTPRPPAPQPQAQAPAPQAQAQQSGALRWPLDNVSVVRGFSSSHDGIDLAAPIGTAVYAAGDGIVTFEGWGQNNSWMLGMAGISILIKHSDIYTGYAHLSRTVIDAGQHVTKGQLIGYSGNTGDVTGPHLHFEVLPLNPNFKVNNGRIDPGPYVS
jgi:murein DD-endopeptidase MepM/ murein hydrolase activator NlpD